MHAQGWWGEVADESLAENKRALAEGGRLVSRFTTLKAEALIVITEANRSITSILTPDEY